MEDLHIAEVDHEEARKTADLMSYFQDLAFTVEALDRPKQMLIINSKIKE